MRTLTLCFLLPGLLLTAIPLLCAGESLTGGHEQATNIAVGPEGIGAASNFSDDLCLQGGLDALSATTRFPYICTIRFFELFACTGVLVHQRLVLTAGHCVYDPSGGIDIRNPSVYCGSEKRDAVSNQYNFTSEAKIAPCWDGDISDGCDLAVLILDRNADLPIPQLPVENEPVPATISLTTLGFGLSSFRPRVQVDTLQITTDFRKCDDETHEGAGVIYHPTAICTVNPTKEDLCRGDSGGPLLIPDVISGQVELGDPTRDKILGVDSWGTLKCDASRPQIFTKLSRFANWIHSVVDEIEDMNDK